jgi:pilus assembly protein Flp/PilA
MTLIFSCTIETGFQLKFLIEDSKRSSTERRVCMLFYPKEKGQGLVEYALILVLVAIVVIVILALLGPAIGNVFSAIMTSI